MKRFAHLVLIHTGVIACTTSIAFSENSVRVEKIAEGQYLEWQDGRPLMDTAQIWTIWRTNDGFEVEDKLPPDKGALLMNFFGNELRAQMSPELREDLRNASMTTAINLRLTKDHSIQTLVLHGKKVADAKQIEIANCQVKETKISCKGPEGGAHQKNANPHQLLYSYPFPLLFTSIVAQSKPAQTIPIKLAILEEEKNKIQLQEASGQLQDGGPEKLTVGQYTFQTEKYVLALETKTGLRRITLWASPQGIVFAMEDSRFAPGLRILLSQYKKYADF